MRSKILSDIPKTVKAIGFSSFLLNTSTLMVYSIFGLYLYNNLGIDLKKIGFLDGVVEGFAFVIKVFSGVISDFFINRKLLIIVGASFMAIAKPLEAIATTYIHWFYAKFLERLGNGLQSTPRDAIVGDWAPKHLKGTSFGLRQTLAAFGSVIGAVLSFCLLKYFDNNFKFVFWMASIPAFLSILTIILFVKDKKHKNPINTDICYQKVVRKISWKDVRNLGNKYWLILLIAGTYMLAKVTESLVIVHIVSRFHLPFYYGPACMICYQIANSIISWPAGMLSDRLKSRDTIIICGLLIFIISDLLFIFGTNLIAMACGLMCLGGYVGISQSIFQAKIVDIVPVDLKGTAIGIFNLVCACSLVIGGSISGFISDKYGTTMTFIVSACISFLSFSVLYFTKNKTSISK